MPFRSKFGVVKSKLILEPVKEIEQKIESINLETKSKSKVLKKETKQKPTMIINNKSKVVMNIPSKRNKKILETDTEINLDTDED